MKKEEAINTLNVIKAMLKIYPKRKKQKEAVSEIDTALDMAIEALKRYDSEGCWENREHVQVDEGGYDVATCSICGSEITLEYPYDNYCPNCGAEMRGE